MAARNIINARKLRISGGRGSLHRLVRRSASPAARANYKKGHRPECNKRRRQRDRVIPPILVAVLGQVTKSPNNHHGDGKRRKQGALRINPQPRSVESSSGIATAAMVRSANHTTVLVSQYDFDTSTSSLPRSRRRMFPCSRCRSLSDCDVNVLTA
jgi:hypothetical protein